MIIEKRKCPECISTKTDKFKFKKEDHSICHDTIITGKKNTLEKR